MAIKWEEYGKNVDEEFSTGFDEMQPGDYLLQFEEGIELYTNTETGSQSIRLPLTAIDAKDDDIKTSIGRKISVFQNVTKTDGDINTFGEKTVMEILARAGVMEHIANSIPNDAEINSDAFILEVKKCLPGRTIFGTVHLEKDLKGKERAAVKSWRKNKKQAAYKGKGGVGSVASCGVSKPAASDDDWG